VEKVIDDRANYSLKKSQAVDSNIPESFYLEISIFKGQPKIKIQIEININADSLNCSLISPEANDYISDQKNQIIDEQIKKISELIPELCIIEQ
jgi:subtilisin-like proprotein convertase family protein